MCCGQKKYEDYRKGFLLRGTPFVSFSSVREISVVDGPETDKREGWTMVVRVDGKGL